MCELVYTDDTDLKSCNDPLASLGPAWARGRDGIMYDVLPGPCSDLCKPRQCVLKVSDKIRHPEELDRIYDVVNHLGISPRFRAMWKCPTPTLPDRHVTLMDYIAADSFRGLQYDKRVDDDLIRAILKKIQKLHDAGIVHHDLYNGTNVLTEDKTREPWIIDFDRARFEKEGFAQDLGLFGGFDRNKDVDKARKRAIEMATETKTDECDPVEQIHYHLWRDLPCPMKMRIILGDQWKTLGRDIKTQETVRKRMSEIIGRQSGVCKKRIADDLSDCWRKASKASMKKMGTRASKKRKRQSK